MLFAAISSAALLAVTPGQIAYSDALGSLYLSQADGSAARTIFTSDGSASLEALEIAPDGKNVLAAESGDAPRLVLVPVAGGARRPIAGTADANGGALSPDGKSVVFSSPAGIFSVAVSGGVPVTLALTPAASSDSLPQYSPDGKIVAFARTTTDSAGDELSSVETMPAAGGTPTARAPGVLASSSIGGRISFSPDGTRLLYAGDSDHPGLASVAVTGGPVTQLTSDLDNWPVFLDTGNVLFARSSTSPNADSSSAEPRFPVADDLYELWTAHADGSSAAVLAEGDYESLAVAGPAPAAAPTPKPAPGPGPAVIAKPPPQTVTKVVAAGGFPLAVACSKACTVTSTLVGRLHRARRTIAAAAPVWGRGTVRRPHGGRSKLFVRLNARAKKQFPKAGRFTLTLRTTVRSGTGSRTTSQAVRFKP